MSRTLSLLIKKANRLADRGLWDAALEYYLQACQIADLDAGTPPPRRTRRHLVNQAVLTMVIPNWGERPELWTKIPLTRL